MLSVPHFRPGAAQLSWERGPNGDVTYRVRGPAGGEARLNPGMALIALMADGYRNLGDIYDELLDGGIGVSDPAHVVLVFQRLEDTGAVEMAWHFESLGEVRHACTGCGRSCEGHLIGPLSAREVDRLRGYREALRVLEPDLPEGEPVIDMPGENGPEPCLNTTLGRCVFFTTERLCAIHKHFGAEKKPLHCQLFPLRVVETEAGFRVGISSRCAMAHRSWRTAPAMTAAQAVAALPLRRPPADLVGLDARAPRSFRPTASFQRNLAQEVYFLALLERPELTLGEVVASADGTHRETGRPASAYCRSVASRLRAFASFYVHDPLDKPDTVYGADMRAFMADLSAVEPPPAWIEPEPPARDYLLHALRQLVYLRETTNSGSVEVGVQVALMGMLGALWTISPWTEGERAADRLGVRVALWLRMQGGGRARDLLFGGFEAFREHLALLGG